jgi:multiple sugar transport system substrate-binding protein
MTKPRTRSLALLCLVLVAAWLGPACSSGTEPQPPPQAGGPAASAGGKVVTIRVLTLGQDPTLDTIIGAFYDKYGAYRITKEQLPPQTSSLAEQLAARIRQGEIDVVQVDGLGATLARQGLLEPLDARMRSADLAPEPFGDVLTGLRYGGQAYELPTTFQPQMLVYNPKLFQAEHVAEPLAGGWTWEEFRQSAAQLTHGEGSEKVWGFSAPLVEQMAQAWFLERSDPVTMAVAPADLREGLEFFRQMVFEDGSVPRAEKRNWAAGAAQYAQADDFSDGKAAMGLKQLPYRGSWRNRDMKWEVAPLPTRTGLTAPLAVSPRTYAIAANSTQQEAAWEFLRFAAGLPGAMVTARSGELPVYGGPSVQEEWFHASPAPPGSTVLAFALPRRLVPAGGATGRSDSFRPLYAAINGVLSGVKSVDEA